MSRSVTGYAELVEVGTGPAGKSAYDIAVEDGFVGTEAEWLESINGEDGVGRHGTRGPGRYELKSNFGASSDFPEVDDEDFRNKAVRLMCESNTDGVDRVWSTSQDKCLIRVSGEPSTNWEEVFPIVAPLHGDIFIWDITKPTTGETAMPSGIYNSNTDTWDEYEVIIDGSLFVENTVAGGAFGSETKVTAGNGHNIATMDGEHSDYRLYAGNSDPSDAPFAVKQDGSVSIKSDTNTNNSRLELDNNSIDVYEGDQLRVRLGEIDEVTGEHGMELYKANGDLSYSSADDTWHFLDSFVVPANLAYGVNTYSYEYTVATGYPEAVGCEGMVTFSFIGDPPDDYEQAAPRIFSRGAEFGFNNGLYLAVSNGGYIDQTPTPPVTVERQNLQSVIVTVLIKPV